MVSLDLSAELVVDRRYAQPGNDPTFAELLALHPAPTEDDLADLIEFDGRKRLALARPIELGRYLEAVPDLDEYPVALDAAIDVTLRSLSGGRRPNPDAVRTLGLNYPDLRGAIHEAAILGRSMLSTTEVQRSLASDLPAEFPQDFGPAMADGRLRYQLLAEIGSGACGAVYRAIDRQLSDNDRPALVAIKLMKFRDESPWARQHFIEEATKARRVNHPNVARVLDRSVSNDDAAYIVYELVEGGDLQSWYERHNGEITPERAARLVALVARAVHAAHIAGVVHCDLKPGNILLTASGEPKVTDFGIAVRAGAGTGPASKEPLERPRGSIAFVSPEQFRLEEGSLAQPTDIYALGGILFFLLTGEYPNGQSIREAHSHHDAKAGRSRAPSCRAQRASVDSDLDKVCRRALCPTAAGRHESAAELASDLETWLRYAPIAWTSPGPGRRIALLSRRRPWTTALVSVLALGVVAGGSLAARFWFISRTHRETIRQESARVDSTKGELERAYGYLSSLKSERIVQELLPSIMVLEWINGSTVLGTDESRGMLWTERIRLVSDLVAVAEREGRSRTLEVLMWRHALAFWLLCDQRPDEASTLIDADLPRWAAILPPDDPWLIQLRALDACAHVQRWQAATAPLPTGPGTPAESAMKALVAAHNLFDSHGAGTPLHLLTLRHLLVLCGERFFKNADLAAKVEAALEKVSG